MVLEEPETRPKQTPTPNQGTTALLGEVHLVHEGRIVDVQRVCHGFSSVERVFSCDVLNSELMFLLAVWIYDHL